MIDPEEWSALQASYTATRRLLRAPNPAAAQSVVLWLCQALGGQVVPADLAGPEALPIDLTVVDGPPALPIAPDPAVGGRLSKYLGPFVMDARLIVDRDSANQRLVEHATTDALTGLWNRRSLELAISRCTAGDCLALLDLDHFKAINDTHGHALGDTVLARFAAHPRTELREPDVIRRVGGEEFVVVFPTVPIEQACAVLHRVRQTWPAAAPVPVTFSAGVVAVPDSGIVGHGGRLALQAADELMYRAKASGRDLILCDTA